jgi:C4-dicarboxylate transporter DctQ subunit
MPGSFLNRLEEGSITFLMAATTLLVFVEVILRFVFNTGMMWAQELTLHMAAWMVILGAPYGLKVGSHIGIDAFVRTLNPRTARLVTGLAVLAGLAYCGLFGYGSWVYAKKMWVTGIELEDMDIPRWLAHGAMLLLGFALLAMRLLTLLWKLYTGQASGFSLADEAKESMELAEEARRLSKAQGAGK